MKSEQKEECNKAICARVNELLGKGKPIMLVYEEVGDEFWLELRTIRAIFTKKGHYSNKWQDLPQKRSKKQ